MPKTAPKKKMGRPRIELDQKQFEDLCGLQCTLEEIAGWFRCDADTVNAWCKRTYKQTFSAAFKRFSQNGKISLRRYQFVLAKKSAAMAIFLGKQMLGQSDHPFDNDEKEEWQPLKSLEPVVGSTLKAG